MGLQLSDPLQTFISVFAQGMSPNLHTLLSVQDLHRDTAGGEKSDPVHRESCPNSSTAKHECSCLYTPSIDCSLCGSFAMGGIVKIIHAKVLIIVIVFFLFFLRCGFFM